MRLEDIDIPRQPITFHSLIDTEPNVRNLEPKQGRIREEHDLWNEKWIIAHVRRTLISYGLYESGKS